MTRPRLIVSCFLGSLLLLPAVKASLRESYFKPAIAAQSAQSAKKKWYKGNTHTHTLNSDGDSSPDDVARWYREHGYQFLVLSDHNYLTSVDGLNALHGADDKFLLIKGEEVSDMLGEKPIHINGLNLNHVVEPQGGKSVVEMLQRNVDAIRKAAGIPHINHPNFRWAITADELRQVENNRLFEIYNGHHQVNNLGGGGVPGLEEVWDSILSSGRLLYGIAVDDAHTFKKPWESNAALPGRGWIYVRTDRLAAPNILAALEGGDFYSSTGVEIADYQVTDRQLSVKVRPMNYSKYRVQFIGKGGKVLKEVLTPDATYDFRGDELYVRTKVIESNGRIAWLQPVMIRKS